MDPATRDRLERLLGAPIRSARPLGGQHGVLHFLLQRGPAQLAFAKVLDPSGARLEEAGFAAEAAGLAWLAESGTVAVPAVLAQDDDALILDWVPPQAAVAADGHRFGKELARLHAAGAERFGSPWPTVIAGLPLPESAEPGQAWGEWYAAARLRPFIRRARDGGTFSSVDAELAEAAAGRAGEVGGPPEPPARLHGDLWSGNVLWSGGRGWLIDPAAHGGHRETDLAMLALFGLSHLDQVRAGYAEAAPLADGWQARLPLHQLHPLLVHVCLFGAAYREPALDAARAVLAL